MRRVRELTVHKFSSRGQVKLFKVPRFDDDGEYSIVFCTYRCNFCLEMKPKRAWTANQRSKLPCHEYSASAWASHLNLPQKINKILISPAPNVYLTSASILHYFFKSGFRPILAHDNRPSWFINTGAMSLSHLDARNERKHQRRGEWGNMFT